MDIKLNFGGKNYTGAVTEDAPPVSPTGLLLVPFDAPAVVMKLDALAWVGEKDGATGGTAVGLTSYPVTIGGRQARAFPSDFTNNGGLRYHVKYGSDTKATHFVYAGDLWFDDTSKLGQMELDNNQVLADGRTVIYGVQCNANDGVWDITKQDTSTHWVPTTAKGNPKLWPAKTWLHFETLSHRDDLGNITYDAVHFNGLTQKIGVTLPSARVLNPPWTIAALLVNFQLGGSGASGSIRAYASNLQVAKW